jgi:hypothetical protein
MSDLENTVTELKRKNTHLLAIVSDVPKPDKSLSALGMFAQQRLICTSKDRAVLDAGRKVSTEVLEVWARHHENPETGIVAWAKAELACRKESK